jgi:putative spermidine/putrescine transport system ATP-binding protein
LAERGRALSGLRIDGLRVAAGDRLILDGLDLNVPDRLTCAVLGPSGSGKTTLLRSVAGLVGLDDGTIFVGSRDVARLPAKDRRIGMAFQEPRLFPNLSVVDNVAYGLRVDRIPKRPRRARAMELLTDVGLVDRADDLPARLSGGEQQRVSLARALCGERDLLLLDEPLSAVDGPARTSLRVLLGELQATRAVTTLLVTHDLADATSLGDLIAVMVEGKVLQCDRPSEILARPVCPEVASLTGNPNVIDGHAHRGAIEVGSVRVPVETADGPLRWTIRPEHVHLGDSRGEPARVVRVEHRADRAWVGIVGTLGTFDVNVPADRALVAGELVCVEFDPDAIWVFPDCTVRERTSDIVKEGIG